MGQIKTETKILEESFNQMKVTIHLTTDNGTPIEVELQIEVDGYPVGWGCTSHNFVEVMAGGNFRKEWEVLKSFLKPEYFNQIETIINQWRNDKNAL